MATRGQREIEHVVPDAAFHFEPDPDFIFLKTEALQTPPKLLRRRKALAAESIAAASGW